MKATEQLMDEHEGVKVMLNILERIYGPSGTAGTLNISHFDEILEFLKVFIDKCHHGKEEDLLFPALIAAGIPENGPITVMLQEHQMGRGYIKAMNDSYVSYMSGDQSSYDVIRRNALDYISLLRSHIEKENNILFVMADRVLSAEKQEELFEGFERIEEERIGVGKHEEFHKMLERLSGIYLK
jgi:hemerythrin-like domain-containing protein